MLNKLNLKDGYTLRLMENWGNPFNISDVTAKPCCSILLSTTSVEVGKKETNKHKIAPYILSGEIQVSGGPDIQIVVTETLFV